MSKCIFLYVKWQNPEDFPSEDGTALPSSWIDWIKHRCKIGVKGK